MQQQLLLLRRRQLQTRVATTRMMTAQMGYRQCDGTATTAEEHAARVQTMLRR
jgi:hypothetical protein